MSIPWLNLPPVQHFVPLLFTYGNYGGLNYSDGRVIGPGDTPEFKLPPTDRLDALFEEHDKVYYNPEATSLGRAQADFDLLEGILALPDDAVSGRGDVYAGLAVLALLYQISVVNGHPELLAQLDLQEVVGHAGDLIAQGSAELTPRDIAGLETIAASLAMVDKPEIALVVDKIEEIVASLEDHQEFVCHGVLSDEAFNFVTDLVETHWGYAAEVVPDIDLSGAIGDALNGDGAIAHSVETALADLPADIQSLVNKFAGFSHHDFFG